ncbi:MAG TPA: MerR family transcriptional regulator [Pseudobacillus sp.]
MRIGSFAKKFDVSIDTVRYYIELGLLIPEKEKTQYQMNQMCLEDMELIHELKHFRFSLKEIHKILSLKRLTNSHDNKDASYFTNLLLEKKADLMAEKDEISKAVHLIDEKIHSNIDNLLDHPKIGIPLFFVPLFCCPHCQQLLNLKEASMQGHYIYEGILSCSCRYRAVIKEGILLTNQLKSSPNKYSIYEIDVKKWNPGFVSLLERGKLWMIKELMLNDLANKVIVETNIEVSMLLPKYLSSLSEKAYYIFTCHSLETIKKLKKQIEKLNPHLLVLYIVNSDLHLPLIPESIDFFIDSTSFTQFSLIYSDSPITILRPYLKTNACIIGSFVFYEAKAKSLKNIQSMYPTSSSHALYFDYLAKGMEHNGLVMAKKEELGFTENPGSYFIYHELDEKMKLLVYAATCVK